MGIIIEKEKSSIQEDAGYLEATSLADRT